MNDTLPQPADTLEDPRERKSSSVILEALAHSEREFKDYNELCRRIDRVYSGRDDNAAIANAVGMSDQEYDTFWASMEVLKPAIYAKPPLVIAKARFSDASAADKVVAELLERVINSEFERNGIDMHMREVRDDVALNNRGVLWAGYETRDGNKGICVEHIDRLDYRHEPVRYWHELGWQARCAWMTEKEMRKRFPGAKVEQAGFITRKGRDDDEDIADTSAKAPVWEVWSKADNRVYWVTEGVDDILDEGEPHLSLRDFFPSPRPAYGTLRRRTLVPVPDYVRYERHLDQINVLTSRIYSLLDQVKRKVLIPAGGDVGDALELAFRANDDAIFIPVPGGALLQNGAAGFAYELPLTEVANTIAGLIEARSQMFADFDRLSGISDIMRGETEAAETLGAQRIKTQYGSVRVKDKTEEMVRLARDAARVAVEIICDKFDRDTLLDISQMVIPTKRDVEKDIEEIRKAAKAEMEALGKKAQEQLSGNSGQLPPEQQQAAQQAFQQGQQGIAEKYAPRLAELSNTVVIEDVMKIIKDRRDRALIIDIETDSTVMVDEMAEKQTRSEMLQAVTAGVSALPQYAAMGDQGIKLFGSLLGFTLQPYTRSNRAIQSQLDELIENAPEIAAKMKEDQSEGDNEGLVEAQKELAKAETLKGQAAMQSAQAKAQLDQATTQIKMAQMQQDAQDAQQKAQHEQQKLQLQLADAQTKAQQTETKQQAEIDYLTAQTAKILASIGLDERKQNLSEYTAASNEQSKQVDQAMAVEGAEHDRAHSERQQDFTEQSSDRQMTMAERQAEQEPDSGR